MRNFTLQILVALACLSPGLAKAADACGPLKEVDTVDLKMSNSKSRAYVPVTINGVEKTFMLDTGGYASQIWPSAAKDLHLPIRESNGKLLDLYGNASSGEAKVDSFVLGHLAARNTSLLLSTFDSGPNTEVAGILGPDFMGRYDTELDFAAGKMNYFDTDHCEGRVVYWPSQAIAVVPMTFRDDRHIVIPLTLDGHPFKAIVDTGATNTTLTMGEARRVFGITAEDSDKEFEHVFQKLSFEGLEVGNPHIAIIPDKVGSKDPNNGFVTGSRTQKVDDPDSSEPTMLIGMNILSKLHLYIAFKERKLYITPASAPGAAAASSAH